MGSLLPTPFPSDPVEGAPGHFDHSNWVKASLIALNDGTLHKADAVVGGPLAADEITIDNPATEEATLFLQGNAAKSVRAKNKTGVMRWRMDLGDATAESGSNSGSRFKLLAYGDNGALLKTVFEAHRSTGLVEVAGNPTASNGIATKDYVDTSIPVGSIIAYGGSSAPPGWLICNGQAHSSAALRNVLNSWNVPDLSGKFIVATGGGYNPGSQGGVASYVLTDAQTPTRAHTHDASSAGEGQEHTHSIDPPATQTGDFSQNHTHYFWTGGGGHGHNSSYGNNYQLSSQAQNLEGATAGPIANTPDRHESLFSTGEHAHDGTTAAANQGHSHSVDIVAFNSGGRSAVHSHAISVGWAAAVAPTQAVENRPPFYALVYIIKAS